MENWPNYTGVLKYFEKLNKLKNDFQSTPAYYMAMLVNGFVTGGWRGVIWNINAKVTTEISYTFSYICSEFSSKFRPYRNTIDKAIGIFKIIHMALNPEKYFMEWAVSTAALSAYHKLVPEKWKSRNFEGCIFIIASILGWNSPSYLGINLDSKIQDFVFRIPSNLWSLVVYTKFEAKIILKEFKVWHDYGETCVSSAVETGNLVLLNKTLNLCNSSIYISACYDAKKVFIPNAEEARAVIKGINNISIKFMQQGFLNNVITGAITQEEHIRSNDNKNLLLQWVRRLNLVGDYTLNVNNTLEYNHFVCHNRMLSICGYFSNVAIPPVICDFYREIVRMSCAPVTLWDIMKKQ